MTIELNEEDFWCIQAALGAALQHHEQVAAGTSVTAFLAQHEASRIRDVQELLASEYELAELQA